MISTFHSGLASLASTAARTGGRPGTTQASQAAFMASNSAMLVTHARRLGHDLGINGVWGNFGAASASGLTALLAATISWRAAFVVPGLVCLACGAAFVALVPGDGDIPIDRIVDTLLAAGYSGSFELELIGDAITEEGYDAAVPRAVAWLDRLLTDREPLRPT